MQKKNEWKKIRLFNMEFYADYHTWEDETGNKEMILVSLTNCQSGVKTTFENGFIQTKKGMLTVMDYVRVLLGYPLKEEEKPVVVDEVVIEEVKEVKKSNKKK